MLEIGTENTLGCVMVLLASGALAIALGLYRCARAGLPAGRTLAAMALAAVLAPFVSHLLYCLTDIESAIYEHSTGYLFAFWERGYMLYGGMLGAFAALALAGGSRRAELIEGLTPGAALMIAAVRIAEGFMGQGYAEYYMDESPFRRFPFMVYDPLNEEWAWALFMLEALVALALFVYLLARRKTWSGDGALLLAGLYAGAQIVLESLRRDEFLRWGFVRVEQVISAVLVLAVLVVYCVKSDAGRRLAKALCFTVYAAMITLCLLLEFATEGRIPFLAFLSVDGCYASMAGACAVLCLCVLYMRGICSARHTEKKGNAENA